VIQSPGRRLGSGHQQQAVSAGWNQVEKSPFQKSEGRRVHTRAKTDYQEGQMILSVSVAICTFLGAFEASYCDSIIE
jgi:hypothetical protein